MASGHRPTRPILPTPRATSPLECSHLRPGPRWARRSGETATGAAVTSTSTPTGRTTSRGTSTTRTSRTPASSTEPREGAGKAETSGSTTPSIARACNTVTTPPSSASTRAALATLSPGRRSVAAPGPTPAAGSRAGLVKRVLGGTARAGSVSRVGAAAVAAAEEVVDDSANLVARVRDHVRARSGGGRAGTRPGARAREAGSTRGRKAGDRAETGGGAAKELRVSRGGDAGPRRGPARGRHQGAVGDPRQREPRARFLRRCGGRQAEPREVPERVRRRAQARLAP